jgi:hypothetical protein
MAEDHAPNALYAIGTGPVGLGFAVRVADVVLREHRKIASPLGEVFFGERPIEFRRIGSPGHRTSDCSRFALVSPQIFSFNSENIASEKTGMFYTLIAVAVLGLLAFAATVESVFQRESRAGHRKHLGKRS